MKMQIHHIPLILSILIILSVGTYIYYNENRQIELQTKLNTLEAKQQDAFAQIALLGASSTDTLATIGKLQNTVTGGVSGLEEKLGNISSTVNTLDKLSKTDDQVLKKYSKAYFLNENYIPASLSNIPADYKANISANEQIHTDVVPFLTKMIDAARGEGMTLLAGSAYRSFLTQTTLKASNKVIYGEGTANKFSAEQGFSEHQLGTTIDFTTAGLKEISTKFDTTPEFTWLNNNAYKYGFIISYPKNNKYYIYESWHWRFVGIALATYLHNENKNFYDMDQRDIDKYLINVFDK